MRTTITATICGLLLCVGVGCSETKTPATTSEGHAASSRRDPTNTAVNERDRAETAKTPLDQNENQQDIDITAGIRRRVVDAPLSVDAHNIKIITQDHKVTLRGPVKSPAEKAQIEAIAQEVAGPANVDSQLEIAESRFQTP